MLRFPLQSLVDLNQRCLVVIEVGVRPSGLILLLGYQGQLTAQLQVDLYFFGHELIFLGLFLH